MPSSCPATSDAASHLGAERIVAGCLVASAGHAAIVRYPLSTALPIPLAVAGPPGIRLVTWAFAGLRAEDEGGPRGLLVLAREEGAALRGGLQLATHFREFDIALDETGELLLPEERMLVARALLASASPDETATLAGLIGLLSKDMAAIVPEANAPAIMRDGDGRWSLSGSDLPGHLLLCEGAGWSCHRIARADLHFGDSGRNPLRFYPRIHPGSLPRTRLGVRGEAESRRSPPKSTDGSGGLRGPLRQPAQDEVAGEPNDAAWNSPHALLTLERAWGKAPAGSPAIAIGLSKDGFTPYRIAG